MARWGKILALGLLWAIGGWASHASGDSFAGGGASFHWGSTSVDSQFQFSWGLERINAPEAWRTTQGNESVIVAVLDSGIDRSHPSLEGRLWSNLGEIPHNNIDDDQNGYVDDIHGWDFQDGDADSLSGTNIYKHGTFTAGLIAALSNETGIAGVAPNVVLMDVRILDSGNRFKYREWPQLTSAIYYAMDNGADVINLSIFSNERPPNTFHQAIIEAVEAGIIIVGATGNNSSSVQYPGKYNEVIAVSAIDKDNQIAIYSNSGIETEFAAPGSDVESLLPNNGFGTSSGTSWATAHVSGAVALLLSHRSDTSLDHIRQILRNSIADLGEAGFDKYFGYGLIDAAAMLLNN
jgi:subtilisin family serine protease